MNFKPSVKACRARKCPLLKYSSYIWADGKTHHMSLCTSDYLPGEWAIPGHLFMCPQPPGEEPHLLTEQTRRIDEISKRLMASYALARSKEEVPE